MVNSNWIENDDNTLIMIRNETKLQSMRELLLNRKWEKWSTATTENGRKTTRGNFSKSFLIYFLNVFQTVTRTAGCSFISRDKREREKNEK